MPLSASVGGAARADDCAAYEGYACYYLVQPPAAPNNQNPGTPGTPVGAANVNIPGVAYPAGEIVIQTTGGAGGTGWTDTGTDNSGANGGQGGNGNTLIVTTQPGTATSGITVIQADGGAGGMAGYSGHQGTVRTSGDGGTAGTVVAGTQAAPITGQFNNPNPAQPWVPNGGWLPSVGLYASASGGAGANGVGQTSGGNDDGGNAGNGGNSSGGVSVVFGGSVSGTQGGIVALSQGGNGGTGGAPWTGDFPVGAQGGNGGNGGTGGSVNVVLMSGGSASSTGTGAAITAQSFGGQGGQGGQGGGDASGGTAGKGADAGSVNVMNFGAVSTTGADSPGILAQSFGGSGGSGGQGGGWGAGGGNGGTGGNGGSVGFVGAAMSSIATTGTNSPGVLLQSIGGGGGNGGNSSGWQAVGGDGAGPGNGGDVAVEKSTSGAGSSPIVTSGERSTGILAQSIGGGGGNGGNAAGNGPTDAFLNIVVGGSGAGGGHGGSVQAAITGDITTSGLHSSGVVLQSIGGGGGNGGSAYSSVVSVIGGASVSVGGNGGGGGDGGPVGQTPDGNGGYFPTSTGRIVTTGANSHGIVGQSIGGGGGNGGVSGSTATTYGVATEEVPTPTVSIAVAIGGSGGNGGNGNSVTLQNTGLIATAGGGSVGLVGQSIGGGGGTGGDASATSTAKGNSDSPLNVSASVALGGKGGGGGSGGPVSIMNGSANGSAAGMIFTRGEAADAILAQSVGGGGGNGGAGDAKAKSSGDGANISAAVSLGGTGGSGGNGGPVTVGNTGALLTLGDGAMGILAQSVGGGGGRGGGAAGTSNGQFSATVAVGGNGAVGGSTTQPNNGYAVAVTNSGTVVTFGADAPAVVAQSIGGGGGLGGKSASTLGNHTNTGDGGNGANGSVSSTVTSLNNAFAAGGEGAVNQYNSVSGLIGVANSALGNVTATRQLGDNPAGDAEGLENLGESGGDNEDSSSSTKVTVHVNVGGRGGAAGDAGNVTVTNSGSIGTVGPMSDGIMAQAIGGGGGRGGAAISSITSGKVNQDDQQGNVPISVGGRGGHGGNAGNVTVNNSGSVTTIGAQSLGIVAQSIAGGGGIAGASAAKIQGNNANNTSVLSLPIAIGANGGGGGSAGTVTVNNSGTIVTRSHDAIGIVAQSIAGGGGIVRTRSSDATDNNGGGAVATGGTYGINLTFGGNCGTSCGQSGEAAPGASGGVVVNHTGSITTGYVASNGTRFGTNAYGVLAQSIGGGGGLVLGGTPNGSNFFGSGAMIGNADQATGVQVTLGNDSGAAGSAGNITTYGQGAIAVVAQSIGGGGGLAGDTGLTAQRAGFAAAPQNSGNGGPVLVGVRQTATLSTDADNTPVILAQSIGGGGGRVTSSGYGAYDGSAGGTGTGGTVTVNVGGQVQAAGRASPGIFAESLGRPTSTNPTGGSAVRINVGPGAVVQGGHDFNMGDGYNAGIYIVGGSTNQDPTSQLNNNVNNQGTITSLGTTAIYSTGGWTSVYNQSGATISGSVNLDNGGGGGACPNGGCAVTGGTLNNAAGATFNTGSVVRLGAAGTLANSGTLSVGGPGIIGTTALTGNLEQSPTGRLVVDTNHATGQTDRLDVQGSAKLAGTVEVHAAALANQAVTVLTATGGVNLDAGLATTRTQLFRFDAQRTGNSLQIQPRAEFAQQAAGLGRNQQGVAAHLQQLWDNGASMSSGYTALAGVQDGAGYSRALNSLSGQTVGAIGAFRYSSSRDFTATMLNECPTFAGAGINQDQASCVWARAFGSSATQDATAGALGYQASAWTLQAGGQREIAPGWFLGGSLAYETSVFRGDAGSSKVSGDSVLAGALLRHQSGSWQISGALDFGYGWYNSQRSIEVDSFRASATANPNIWHAGAHSRIAYQVPFGGLEGGWYIQPRVDLHLNYVRSGSYTETGAGPFNLAVASGGATTFTTTPAIEVGGRVRLAEGAVLRPFASAGIELNANNDWATTARFAGQTAGSGFRTKTPIPDMLGKFTVGADLLSSTNWDLRVQYSTQLGDGYTSHAGMARVAYRF